VTTEGAARRDIDPVQELARHIAKAGCSPIPSDQLTRIWKEVLYPELELRVGLKLTHGMSDAKLGEFEALVDAGDDDAPGAWLEKNVSNYPEIVATEIMAIVDEAAAWFINAEGPRATEVCANV